MATVHTELYRKMGEVSENTFQFLFDVVCFFLSISFNVEGVVFFCVFPIGWFVVFCEGSIDVFGELGRTSA